MSPGRKRFFKIFQAVLAVAIIAAFGWHFYRLLSANPLQSDQLTLRFEYLIPAGLLYLAAHTIWATFFYQLLRGQGGNISWFTALRAYFVSQVGKYVPGKAWVIVLRMMILRHYNLTPTVVGVVGVYETVTSMAAGAMVGAIFLPWSGLVFEAGSAKWLAIAAVASMPIGTILLNRLAIRIARKVRGPEQTIVPKPPFRLLVLGLLQGCVGWCLLGFSVYLALCGMTTNAIPLTPELGYGLLGANAIAYISGFIAIILPGGLGAREELLQRMLAVQLQPFFAESVTGFAIVAALVLRLTWTLFEAAISILLWFWGRRSATIHANQ
ncbi:MAG: lysylphosphatidylglycerol synthase domain-containing protein [Fimbriiglobus sp.]